MKNFSQLIQEARIKAGYGSQVEAAKTLGLPQRTYAHYESGRSFPKEDLFRQICVKFGVSADWLLGLQDATFEQEIRQRNIAIDNSKEEFVESLSKQNAQYDRINKALLTRSIKANTIIKALDPKNPFLEEGLYDQTMDIFVKGKKIYPPK